MKTYDMQTLFPKKSLTCLLFTGLLAGLPAHALTTADGVVTVPHGSTNETLVDVTGVVELATNIGGDDVQNPEINGVVFNSYRPNGSNTIVGPNSVTLQGTSVTGSGSAWRNLGYGLWGAGSIDYTILFTRLLDNQSPDPAGSLNFNITGLNASTTYRVQVISGDSRNLGTTITHTLGGVGQSSALTVGNDGMISVFTVTGQTSVTLTVTSNLVGGTPPLIQGLLVTSIPDGLSAPGMVSGSSDGSPINLTVPVSNAGATAYNVTSTSYSGANAGDFSTSTVTPLAIAAGGSQDITVSFTPGAGGTRTATLTLATDDPSNPTIDVDLSVNVTDPKAVVDTSKNFGVFVVPPGPTAQNVNVENQGATSSLNVSSPVITGPGASAFSVTLLPAAIAAGGFGQVQVTFNPASSGYYAAELELATNDPFQPTVTTTLSGEVTGGLITPTVEAVSTELTGFGRAAAYTVDGSGMTGLGSAGSMHAKGEGNIAWTSNGIYGGFGFPAVNDLDPEITYDLGGVYTVTKIREWGYNEAGINIIGPNEVEIFTSDDNVTYNSAGTVNFALAPGTNGYTGHDIAVNLVGVRYIRFDIKTNHDGAVFNGTGTTPGADGRSLTGLSEIRFEVVPGLTAPVAVSDSYNGGVTQLEVVLSNTATSSRTLGTPTVSGGGAAYFSVSLAPSTIAGGGTDSILVNFNSASSGGGTFTTTLTIPSNDPTNPSIEVTLTVEVRDPEAVATSSLSFGQLATGPGTSTQQVTVDNFGENINLVLSNPQITGAGASAFSVGTLPGPISPGGFANFGVNLNLSTVGVYTAQLTVQTNDPFHPTFTVNLSGEVTAIAGNTSIKVTSVAFVSPGRLRIEFEGVASTTYVVFSSPDMVDPPGPASGWTGPVTPAVNGLTTNNIGGGRGVGFAEIDVPMGAQKYFYRIQNSP